MTRPLFQCNDLRERHGRVAAGETIRVVAAALRISPRAFQKWSDALRATAAWSAGRWRPQAAPVLSGAHADWLPGRVSSAFFYAAGTGAELAERGVKVDIGRSGSSPIARG